MNSSYFKEDGIVRKYSGTGSIGITNPTSMLRELRRMEREIDRLRLEVHNLYVSSMEASNGKA